MKDINLINVELNVDENNIDKQMYENLLTDCVSKISTEAPVVNLIKVKLGSGVDRVSVQKTLLQLKSNLQKLECSNCVYVPLIEGYIEDIQIDRIEVVQNNTNNNSD